jgi:hypothetical protein
VRVSKHSKGCWQVVGCDVEGDSGEGRRMQGIGKRVRLCVGRAFLHKQTPEKGGALHYSRLGLCWDGMAQAPSPPHLSSAVQA